MNKKFHFYAYSDIHIETKKNFISFDYYFLNKDSVNICLLAGDIGLPSQKSYWDFIYHCATYFNYVLIICGNHEYYFNDYYNTHNIINNNIISSNFTNIHFLENNTFIIPNTNIHIHGCTLWTNIPDNLKEELNLSMTEYLTVKFNNKLLNTTDTCNFHNNSVNWLKTSLNPKNINIVLTHHSPTFKNCHYDHQKGRNINHCLSTNLEDLLFMVNYWIYGHVHLNVNNNIFELNGCKLISNQFGYNNCPFFNEKFYFEILLNNDN
jgi:hypothetical protein